MTEKGSPISRRIRHTGDLLLGGAQKQVSDYKQRFDSLQGSYDAFLSHMIESYPADAVSVAFVDEFFGKRELTFAGVDGTVCKYPVFDLIVFFAGAYSAHGTAHVNPSGAMNIECDDSCLETGLGVSSVLPVYINDVLSIDRTLLVTDEDGSVDDSITLSDSWVIDNSAFADYMMSLAEFYLGYKLVASEKPVDILFLDRICSSELSSFYFETSDSRNDLETQCGLIGAKVDGRPYTPTDWVYARQVFGNASLGTPPARGEYLLPRVVTELLSEKGSGLTRDQLTDRLGLTTESSKARLDHALETGIGGKRSAQGILVREHDHFVLKPGVRDLGKRTERLVNDVCERMFSEDSSVTFEDRFKIGSKWLTTTDLAFLGLCCLHLISEKCWKNRSLLIGVAKDSSARDLKRQLLPVLNYTGHFKGNFANSENIPDTDRMILQWVSLQEREKLKVPWATCEYDTAFKTTVPHFGGAKGLVSGARRNQISLNKTFAKAYFQLSEAKSDPKLRSNVLLYDRLVYPDFDTNEDQVLTLLHDYMDKPDEPEPVDVVLYLGKENAVQSFIIALFTKMTGTSIPELFGHLRPLYIADKIAKFHYTQFSSMVESTGSWLTNRPQLREFLFYLSTFRERRSEVEQTRKYG
ncbi:MAG: hypothetical protein C4K47_04350 [Candidatus Thorarchaeota archaeon]|nr:MAG: hypothetical protein C4K47_04350 [Candidatus Thorarchaeota archaeon]